VFEPLPASRKYFSRLADRKAPRNAEGVRIAAPKPPPQEHPYGLTSPLDARPSAEMMDSLAARIAADATQPLGGHCCKSASKFASNSSSKEPSENDFLGSGS
jgi:hypothetical protein